jgi:hypothetical protein
MASSQFAPDVFSCRRISLADIDAAVSARLGPTRGLGNSQPACFNRQVGMYLARHVGRWSTTVIGRFYNGRDHSTVCYGIQRIEALRESDPDVDALISDLKHELSISVDSPAEQQHTKPHSSVRFSHCDLQELADLIADRVYARIEKRVASDGNCIPAPAPCFDGGSRRCRE